MNLQDYITNNGLKATIISVDASTRTVEETCKELRCKREEIVKTIVVVDSSKMYYLIILQGNRRIKTSKLKKLLLVRDITLAAPKKVKKQTGYYVGDVPPISLQLPTILDELVLNQQIVYGGGGDTGKNVCISVEELIECTHPLIADVSVPL
ncbi:MAG: aminoacyl-tRNA deacylase [Candidatus Hodarchaeales archaeon]|jgi:prolyl-tRNA editing enzyme YbaK/EbsC (Cys-tRNA(Pro) deacylase)